MKSLSNTLLLPKSLIPSGLVIFSLALTGNAAMAANLPVAHNRAPAAQVSHPRAPVHVAARRQMPPAQLNFDVGQFIQAMLGGPLPPQYAQIVRNAVKESASHRYAGSSDYSPSYDPSPTVDVDNSQSQAAIDASDQAIQQEDQSLQDLDASVAAAEQQNDAANAAALQTDINAGM
jgi:hypothetical protein